MDRDRPRRPRPRRRIPRTRGDGPLTRQHDRGQPLDSPHPRGWTVRAADQVPVRQGFPAPAGMDPSRRGGRTRRRGIPRTRGDGPGKSTPVSSGSADSPHPRGWTPRFKPRAPVLRGFPAPAGMDPPPPPAPRAHRRIPRTRGDGPDTAGCGRDDVWDSPHPRGWTQHPARVRPGDVGFPAPAGMDPTESPDMNAFVRIPRTRGDGP